MDRPQRISTNGGRVKGTSREEDTTMTSTRGVLDWRSPEIKGATTPVDTPDKSRAERPYSGQRALKRKKRAAGKRIILMKRKTLMIKPLLCREWEISERLIERKLRKRSAIIV
jgi:hypothetical protein